MKPQALPVETEPRLRVLGNSLTEDAILSMLMSEDRFEEGIIHVLGRIPTEEEVRKAKELKRRVSETAAAENALTAHKSLEYAASAVRSLFKVMRMEDRNKNTPPVDPEYVAWFENRVLRS